MCRCGYSKYRDNKYFRSFSNNEYSKNKYYDLDKIDRELNEHSPYEYFDYNENNTSKYVIFILLLLFLFYHM